VPVSVFYGRLKKNNFQSALPFLKNKGKMCDNSGDNEANDLLSTPPEIANIAEKGSCRFGSSEFTSEI
jgi:hypothetical protein